MANFWFACSEAVSVIATASRSTCLMGGSVFVVRVCFRGKGRMGPSGDQGHSIQRRLKPKSVSSETAVNIPRHTIQNGCCWAPGAERVHTHYLSNLTVTAVLLLLITPLQQIGRSLSSSLSFPCKLCPSPSVFTPTVAA